MNDHRESVDAASRGVTMGPSRLVASRVPCVEHVGTYRGLECRIMTKISDIDDGLLVRMFLRRSPAAWVREGQLFYRGNCVYHLASKPDGAWPAGSWERLGKALEECWAFVHEPFTAKEAGLA